MLYHWDDVRFFLEVHRAGSLMGAARRLRVSHTTVSRHIARLQQNLSVELFEKGDTGLTLTEAGYEILSLARGMEDLGTSLGDRIASKGSAVSGTIRIGAPDGFGNAFLSRVLPGLRQTHPGIEIELVPVPRSHKLWKRDVDIAISLERPETGRLALRKLTDYDLRLYGSVELLERMGTPQSVTDLREFSFIGYIADLLYTEELDFNSLIHPDLHASYRAATVKAQLDAVLGGAGLGVLPCFMVGDTGLVPVLSDQIGFTRAYWLLIPEDIRDWDKVRVVADFIARSVRAHAASFRFAHQDGIGVADPEAPPI